MDKKELFLMEYENLCKKHKMIITACGCCNSPFTYSEKEMNAVQKFENALANNIKHLSEGN